MSPAGSVAVFNYYATAERYFRDPDQEHFEAFMATCLPLFNTTPLDPDMLARVLLRPEVDFHFTRGEGFTASPLRSMASSASSTNPATDEHILD